MIKYIPECGHTSCTSDNPDGKCKRQRESIEVDGEVIAIIETGSLKESDRIFKEVEELQGFIYSNMSASCDLSRCKYCKKLLDDDINGFCKGERDECWKAWCTKQNSLEPQRVDYNADRDSVVLAPKLIKIDKELAERTREKVEKLLNTVDNLHSTTTHCVGSPHHPGDLEESLYFGTLESLNNTMDMKMRDKLDKLMILLSNHKFKTYDSSISEYKDKLNITLKVEDERELTGETNRLLELFNLEGTEIDLAGVYDPISGLSFIDLEVSA